MYAVEGPRGEIVMTMALADGSALYNPELLASKWKGWPP